MQKYLMALTVFMTGAAVMVFEIAGARVLAPYLGTAIYVWASLIGVILGSLSIGYWIGGKIADRGARISILSLIVFASAILILAVALIKDVFLTILQSSLVDPRALSLIAAIVLFTPASVLLGMVSPYAIRMRIHNLSTSGTTVGNLYALSTVGSIVGTLSTGFFLITYLGNTKILLTTALVLIILSFILAPLAHKKGKLGLSIVVLAFVGTWNTTSIRTAKGTILDIDTPYNRVWIYDTYDQRAEKAVRRMQINNESSSAMFLNDDELVYEYTKYYRLAKHFVPDLSRALMIGGGAYSYPKDFLAQFPNAEIDVVEIDPQLTALAKQYFRLKDNPRLRVFHEDGRVFLNRNQKKYNVIFGDAFRSFRSIPYQLTTKEAVQKIRDALTPDGVALVNVISAFEGPASEFLRAEYATYAAVFPQVYLLAVQNPLDGAQLQNIMLVALKSAEPPALVSAEPEIDRYLSRLWINPISRDKPILTDEYAPVEYYIRKTIGI